MTRNQSISIATMLLLAGAINGQAIVDRSGGSGQ